MRMDWFKYRRLLPRMERVGAALFACSIFILIFISGFFSAYFGFFPFKIIENAIVSAAFVMDLHEDWGSDFPDFIYYDQEGRKQHENIFTSRYTQDGVTAVNYFHEGKIYLIDSAGAVLHTYEPKLSEADRNLYFSEFSRSNRGIDRGKYIYVQDFHVYPNGDAIMMLSVAGGIWPLGTGLVKVDRNSNVLWKSVEYHTHHEFDVADDGRIFVLASERHEAAPEGVPLPEPYRDDNVLILGPDGKPLDRISVLNAILNSPYEFLLNQLYLLPANGDGVREDILHTNDIDIITEAQARIFPYAEAGDLLISMRDMHAIGVLDVRKGAFKWLKRGPWIGQHDPDILPNGNLMILDNLGDDRGAGRSRIIEFDPKKEQVVWSYGGTAQEPFDTSVRGSKQVLPNGNVLISETVGGRVFEVTRSGKIVWQFVSPFRYGDKKQYVPAVRWPQRLAMSYFTPDFRAELKDAAATARRLDGGRAGDAAGPQGAQEAGR